MSLPDISLFTVAAETIAVAVPKARAESVTVLDGKMNPLWEPPFLLFCGTAISLFTLFYAGKVSRKNSITLNLSLVRLDNE